MIVCQVVLDQEVVDQRVSGPVMVGQVVVC